MKFFSLLVVQFIILLPFVLSHHLKEIPRILMSLSGNYSYISLNSGNIWYLLMKGNLRWTGDYNMVLGMTAKKLGLLMSYFSLGLVLLPIAGGIVVSYFQKRKIISDKLIVASFALSVLVFFYFNTQMHERYSYPAIALSAIFCLMTRQWWIYILISIAYLAPNDLSLMSLKGFDYSIIIYYYHYIPFLYLIVIVSLFLNLPYSIFKNYRLKSSSNYL